MNLILYVYMEPWTPQPCPLKDDRLTRCLLSLLLIHLRDSLSSPSSYKCNPIETCLLRRCCMPSTYLMDGVTSGNPFVSVLALFLREREQIQLQEVSMGSTMGCYKYSHRGFSTHLHTKHSCSKKLSVLAQFNVQMMSLCSRYWLKTEGRLSY